MISIAIGVKEPSASRRYRQTLADSGFETLFATDLPELARIVKSRPIDVVVFDLGEPSLSVEAWLDSVSRDGDLGLTPILWVGSKVSPSLHGALESYRPGMWLKDKPQTEDLIAAVLHLMGRQVDTAPVPTLETIKDPHEWTPQDDLIDDALQIFDEGQKTPGPAPDPAHEGHRDPASSAAERIPTPGGRPASRQDQAQQGSLPKESSSELEIDEVRTTHLTDPRRRINTGSQPRRAVVVSHTPAGTRTVNLDPATVEQITCEVVDRILRKIAGQLDNEFIRREIQAVVREKVR